MGRQFTILISDRNRNVREFLQREMMAEGYRVRLAKSGREVLEWAYHHESIDLVILDLDLPDASEMAILEKLEDRIPTLPVVIHAFLSDYDNHPAVLNAAALVEKEGNSVERLKKVVAEILGKLSVEP
ncbi:MAG: response regulator [Gammaproteobacteria bacterium]|nr:response regulator [Gammaproteobacteria bacterium]